MSINREASRAFVRPASTCMETRLNILYSITCPNEVYNEAYIDEACCQLEIRAEEHGKVENNMNRHS